MAIDRGPTLLAIARGVIGEELGWKGPPIAPAPWLEEPGATFVTLKLQGALRGCIGSLTPRRTLHADVAFNARAAAFEDARFPPLSREAFPEVEIEVSLLSPLEPLPCQDQDHLLAQLRPGVDGLLLEWGPWRGVFLPQVWQELPDPRDFLAHLKQKAGLDRGFWEDGIRFSRFTVTRFQEQPVAHSRG